MGWRAGLAQVWSGREVWIDLVFYGNYSKRSDHLLSTLHVIVFVVDGYYLEWGSWSICTQTCGSGRKYRERECTQPKHGGKNCSGEALSETDVCTNPSLCSGKRFMHVCV